MSSEEFQVTNTGAASSVFTFSALCSGTGITGCSLSVASDTLAPGETVPVSITYQTLAAGTTGEVRLRVAAGGVDLADGWVTVTVVPDAATATVTPDGTPFTKTASTANSQAFTVTNTSTTARVFTVATACSGTGVSGCSVPADTLPSLAAGDSVSVTVTYQTAASGTGVVSLQALHQGALLDSGHVVITVGGGGPPPPPSSPPFVSFSVSGGTLTFDSRYLLQETAITYDGFGRITQLADARGKVTNYTYGGNPQNAFLTGVTRVTDGTGPASLVTTIGYDINGNVAAITDEGGATRSFQYDGFGRLTRVVNSSGNVVKAFGYLFSRTSGNGWTFNPASPNAVVDSTFMSVSPTLRAIVTTGYLDGLGRPIQSATQNGAETIVAAKEYDTLGRPWRTWKPYPRSGGGYDPNFAASATAYYNSALGVANAKPYSDSTYTADALSRVASIVPEFVGTSATALTTFTYGFDTANRWARTTVTDESGKQQRTATDLLGNPVETVLGLGAAEATTTRLEFSVAGDRTRATDPRGLVTTYAVNTRGLQIARTSPDAGTQQLAYDAAGQVRFSQDANQATSGTVAFTTYDFAGRPLVSGLGSATFGSLNPSTSSALETTTANWLVVSAYDAKPSSAGYPWSLFSAQLAGVTFTNVTGRLAATASKSHGAWQVTLFSYDLDGRVTTRHTFTQNYMANAVLAALTTTTTYTRDLRDAILTRVVTTGARTFRHWYDYDARGLLSAAFASTGSTKPGTPDVTYTYRPTGQVATRQFAGGPVVPFGYTIREQLAAIGDVTGTTIPFSARYTYNPNGTVSQADFYNGGVSDVMIKRYRYSFPAYDALNRLQSADFGRWTGTGWSMTASHDLPLIQYDKAGNITALKRNGPNGTLIDNLTYSYTAGTNRLASVTDAVGSTTATWDAETGGFTYDANGNMLTAPAPYGVTAASYDHRNLPLLLTANGVMSAYRYDEQGQRISKRVTGSNLDEFYILDGRTSLGVVTVDGAGSAVSWTWNVLAGDKVVGRETQTAQRLYYHTDLLGSTRVVVQGAAIVEAYDYDPWGVRLEGRILAGPTKEGFTTKERDAETGLDYFGARYYMAALGRWTSVDPLAEKHLEWSPYNYVLNNPVVLIDPDGRQIRMDLGDFNQFGPNGDLRITEDGRVVADREGQVARAKGALLAIGFLPTTRVVGGVLGTAADIAAGNFTFKGALLNFLLGGKGKVAGKLDEVGDAVRLARETAEGLGKLGREGAGRGIREVVGDAGDARKLFDKLRGGNSVKEVKPGVFIATGADGGIVTFRAVSQSGPPTVDVNGIAEGVRKIKFLEQ